MRVISENTAPGRWDEVRDSHINEVKMTGVIKVTIEEASAKISDSDPDDNLSYRVNQQHCHNSNFFTGYWCNCN